MAALGIQNPTLLDLQKRLDPDGTVSAITELLSENNDVLEDMTWTEGNLPTGHRSTVRTGIPSPSFRKFYGFTQPSKSTTAQITDDCGMLEDYASVDKALAELNGNTMEFRLSEDMAFIEGFRNKTAYNIFLGDQSVTPEGFNGLGPRFNDLSAENGDNIIDGGGTGADNASIWLVCWSPMTAFGIVPKGSKAGLQVTDKGQQTEQDTVGGSQGKREVYVTHYRWDQGMVLKDWRYVVRIANIDKSALTYDAASGANLPKLMFEAQERLQSLGMGRCAWYMNRHVRTKLRQQLAYGVQNSTLMMGDVGGKRVMVFGDEQWPVRRVDQLAADEAQIT